MSSFFTTPASQRKRKRDESAAAIPSAKRPTTNSKAISKVQKSKNPRPKRDESISGSGSEDEPRHNDLSENDGGLSSSSEDKDETGAERRLRLAERYLKTIQGEVDEVGFDAEEIDRDLISERLQEDVVCLSNKINLKSS